MNQIPNQKLTSMEEFKSMLKRHKMKATRQRLAVHEAMMNLGHASADMVCEELAAKGTAKVTVASVYNILSQLADIKVYSRRMSSNNKMYFDVLTTKHIHLYDKENHRFRDIFDEELMDLIRSRLKRRKFKGFTVEDIDIQIIAKPTRKLKTAL